MNTYKTNDSFKIAQQGFTLLELVVVMTVVAIGSTLYYQHRETLVQDRIIAKTVEGITLLDEGLYAYEVDNDAFPSDVSDLSPYIPNLQNIDATSGDGGRNGIGGRYTLVPYPDGIGIRTTLETVEQLRGVQSAFPNTGSIDTVAMTVTVGIPISGLVSLMDGFLPKDGSEPFEGNFDLNNHDILDVRNVYASTYYDDDNSSYYSNPAGRSELNTLDFASARDQNNTAYTIDPSGRSELNTLDFVSARDQNNTAYTIDPSGRSELNTLDFASARDQNNTAYTIDPSGQSELNTLDFASARDRNNTAYTIDPSGRSELNTLDVRSIRDQDATDYYLDPSATTRANYVDMNYARLRNNYIEGAGCTSKTIGTDSSGELMSCISGVWVNTNSASRFSISLTRSFVNQPNANYNLGSHHFCSLNSTWHAASGNRMSSRIVRTTENSDGSSIWYLYRYHEESNTRDDVHCFSF